jgi:hypothetical protein
LSNWDHRIPVSTVWKIKTPKRDQRFGLYRNRLMAYRESAKSLAIPSNLLLRT